MHFGTDPQVIMRQKVEARIITAVAKEAIKQGFWLSVFDGEEHSPHTNQLPKIKDALMETDEDYLILYDGNIQVAWFRFVYGNDGWDVICDYSANDIAESVVVPANKIVESLGG